MATLESLNRAAFVRAPRRHGVARRQLVGSKEAGTSDASSLDEETSEASDLHRSADHAIVWSLVAGRLRPMAEQITALLSAKDS